MREKASFKGGGCGRVGFLLLASLGTQSSHSCPPILLPGKSLQQLPPQQLVQADVRVQGPAKAISVKEEKGREGGSRRGLLRS